MTLTVFVIYVVLFCECYQQLMFEGKLQMFASLTICFLALLTVYSHNTATFIAFILSLLLNTQ